MPYYDLRCVKCAFEFERKIGMFDELPACPECKNGTIKVYKNVPLVKFRGEGFAINDLKEKLNKEKE